MGSRHPQSPVVVAVVQIRIVCMSVPHGLVPMPMRVWLGHGSVMRVAVVFVVHVTVFMLERVV
jgi:hypothetical protein